MNTQVFINLPVADVAKSLAFFKALGYPHNPQFTGDTAACIVVSDAISVMLLAHARFRDFTPKDICDTSKAVEVLLTLGCESREQVDGLVARALARAARPTTSRRITASCIRTAFSTWTAMGGGWSTWAPCRRRNKAEMVSGHYFRAAHPRFRHPGSRGSQRSE